MQYILSDILKEYRELNVENAFQPVAVGKYGIKKREEIYKKELAKDYSKNKVIRKDTLTIGMGSNQIDVGVLCDDFVYSVSPAYHTFKINTDIVNSKYLELLFKANNKYFSSKHLIISARQGKSVNIKGLLSEKVEIPDVDEQIKTIEKLSALDSQANRLKEMFLSLDKIIKSRFIEMFGRIDNTDYDLACIRDLCEFVRDGTHQTPTYTDDTVNGFKFLSSKDVISGIIDWSNIKYIPKELHEQLYKTVKPQKNDILLAKNGTTGTAALVDVDEVFDIYVSLALLRFKKCYNPKYMLYAINNEDTKAQFDANLIGVGVPNLHLGRIKETKLIVPPKHLQDSFVEFVELIDKTKSIVRKQIELLQELMDKKMSEYFD